jgi:hypothetical protein
VSKIKGSVKEAVDKQADNIEKAAAHVTKAVQDAKPAKPVSGTLKPKPTAKEFEAEQVTKLKGLFTPKQAAAPEPAPVVEDSPETAVAQPKSKTLATPKVGAVQTQADTPWNPNPFRDDDPEPTDIPEPIMNLRNALMNTGLPNELDPFIREATEQIYRGSQIVPWVNAVIPIGKILPSLAPALGDDDAARDARQTIITELIKTTPPGSAVYYGYDIVADLINLEEPGAALKVQAVATVWDLLDPFELAHNKGNSGIGGAAGS